MTLCFQSSLNSYPNLKKRFPISQGRSSESNPPNPFDWKRIDEGLLILQKLDICSDSKQMQNLSNRYHVVIPYSGDTRDRPTINNQNEMATALRHLNGCAELLSTNQSLPNKITSRRLGDGDRAIEVIKEFVSHFSHPGHGFRIQVDAVSELTTKKQPLRGSDLRLLFHGTESNAVLSIIENGFFVPQTNDGMFGKGIYFTDVSTKAAQYCYSESSTHGQPGYLLLCEVALGESQSVYKADKSKLAKDYDSRTCIGQYQPNEEGFDYLGNAAYPKGSQLIKKYSDD
ncbi:hypothetical protein Ciccas_010370, partial [Cichlidogyrus casuarinus]